MEGPHRHSRQADKLAEKESDKRHANRMGLKLLRRPVDAANGRMGFAANYERATPIRTLPHSGLAVGLPTFCARG
jgi:hypothetical protein